MTLTFIDLYNTCAGQPWSMYDSDAESIDDLESALKYQSTKLYLSFGTISHGLSVTILN